MHFTSRIYCMHVLHQLWFTYGYALVLTSCIEYALVPCTEHANPYLCWTSYLNCLFCIEYAFSLCRTLFMLVLFSQIEKFFSFSLCQHRKMILCVRIHFVHLSHLFTLCIYHTHSLCASIALIHFVHPSRPLTLCIYRTHSLCASIVPTHFVHLLHSFTLCIYRTCLPSCSYRTPFSYTLGRVKHDPERFLFLKMRET